jgi:hypothetical protein
VCGHRRAAAAAGHRGAVGPARGERAVGAARVPGRTRSSQPRGLKRGGGCSTCSMHTCMAQGVPVNPLHPRPLAPRRARHARHRRSVHREPRKAAAAGAGRALRNNAPAPRCIDKKCVRLAQNVQVSPRTPVGMQLKGLKVAQLLGQLGISLAIGELHIETRRPRRCLETIGPASQVLGTPGSRARRARLGERARESVSPAGHG